MTFRNCSIILIIAIIALIIWLVVASLGIILSFVGVGLVVGIVPAVITSIINYFTAINDEITHPVVRVCLNIFAGICSLAIVGISVYFVIGLAQAFL